MTERYEISDLDCAHCAQRIEDAVNRLDGVECRLSFALAEMKVTTERDLKTVEKEIKRIMRVIEPDASIRRLS